MIAFEVKDMTCGHCVGAITRAVKAVDGDAQVSVDLAAHRVHILPSGADAAAFAAAITAAGYSPTTVDAAAAKAGARTGGCCGPKSAGAASTPPPSA